MSNGYLMASLRVSVSVSVLLCFYFSLSPNSLIILRFLATSHFRSVTRLPKSPSGFISSSCILLAFHHKRTMSSLAAPLGMSGESLTSRLVWALPTLFPVGCNFLLCGSYAGKQNQTSISFQPCLFNII